MEDQDRAGWCVTRDKDAEGQDMWVLIVRHQASAEIEVCLESAGWSFTDLSDCSAINRFGSQDAGAPI
jgi:hypothetical protein